MSRIKELRASIEKKLDAWQHQALTLEAQLTETKEQALERLEQSKQQLGKVLKQVQTEVKKSKGLAEQGKTTVQTMLDQLRAQFTQGTAVARETFEEQRTNILKALNEFAVIANQRRSSRPSRAGSRARKPSSRPSGRRRNRK